MSQLSKVTKIALLLQCHTQGLPPVDDEEELMKIIALVINGLDHSRVDWGAIIEFVNPEGENDNG